MSARTRVLFVCTHNAARSQMAEGFLDALGQDRFDVESAGTEATAVHPLAVRAMRDVGIDISRHESKTVERFLGEPFDLVVTVCDAAAESCPVFPNAVERRHWSFPDPSSATGSEDERLAVFAAVRDAIRARIERELLATRTTEGASRPLRARADLDAALARVRQDIAALAARVDVAIDRGVDSLARLDRELAETVIAEDRETNALRYRIEDEIVDIMATQQPIAHDLRFCISALNVAMELERMADYAAGIAQVTLLHEGRPLLKPLVDVPRMATLVREMLRRAIVAYLERDASAAEDVAAHDDDVDRLYDQVYRELLTYLMVDRTQLERATWLLWVGHNLERVGDRIQNICERTIYEATGRLPELTAPDA